MIWQMSYRDIIEDFYIVCKYIEIQLYGRNQFPMKTNNFTEIINGDAYIEKSAFIKQRP